MIPPHHHLLYANGNTPGYSGATTADATYLIGITDASDVMLMHNTALVDAVCFYFDTTTQGNLTGCATPYMCEGTPIVNVHNNMAATNVMESLERLPGGAAGNQQNTGNNAADFMADNPTVGPKRPRESSSTVAFYGNNRALPHVPSAARTNANRSCSRSVRPSQNS